jgi:hypothetical protein
VEIMSVEKQIANLEEALIIWSNIWGFAMSEHRFNEAEAQILKLRSQIAKLKGVTE